MVDFVARILTILEYTIVLMIVAGVIAIAVMYVIDVTQTSHAIRRNFPVVGRFRYFFDSSCSVFSGFSIRPHMWPPTLPCCHVPA